MGKKVVELLAPAGNINSFKAAINAGADAIYMGFGKYNARVMAQNFTLDEYIKCLDYAHIRGVKVYLTLNTLVEDSDIKEILDVLLKLYEYGLDAVILQDIGLASIIHKAFPDLHMHASTQMSAYSLEQVKFLQEIGFKRVVLARELSLEEIKYIVDNADVEIEVFIHGALCVSVSGQCLMSLSIGSRSANKGECAQPCRMKYKLYDSKDNKLEDTYLLSKKDIYGLDILKDIMESNITSLKIEGRNKTPEYVAYVTSRYRKYIDLYIEKKKFDLDNEEQKNLLQMFNRSGKSHGYLKGVEYKNSITTISPKNTGIFLGKVIEKKGGHVKLKLETNINLHDGIEIYNDKNIVSTIVTSIKDNNLKQINCLVKKGNVVYIGDINQNVNVNDKIYKTSSSNLNDEIRNKYLKRCIRRRKIELNIKIKNNETIKLFTKLLGKEYVYDTLIVPQKSQNKPINIDVLKQVFSKTQDNGIEFSNINAQIEDGLFVKISSLNEARRNFVSILEEKCCIRRNTDNIQSNMPYILNEKIENHKIKCNFKNILSVYNYNKNINYVKYYLEKYNKKLDRIDFQIKDYIKYQDEILSNYSKYNLGINLGNFTLKNTDKYIKENLEFLLKNGVNIVIIGSYRYIKILTELKKKYKFYIVADYSLNINNIYSANFISSLGIDIIVPDFDCSEKEINNIYKYFDVELVDDYITVMTSRYCMLGSFIGRENEKDICNAPCKRENYYILDKYKEKYNIITNNYDCTMSIVKRNKQKFKALNCYIRNTIL